MNTLVDWNILPEADGLILYKDLFHHDCMIPAIASLFGDSCLDVNGIVIFSTLI